MTNLMASATFSISDGDRLIPLTPTWQKFEEVYGYPRLHPNHRTLPLASMILCISFRLANLASSSSLTSRDMMLNITSGQLTANSRGLRLINCKKRSRKVPYHNLGNRNWSSLSIVQYNYMQSHLHSLHWLPCYDEKLPKNHTSIFYCYDPTNQHRGITFEATPHPPCHVEMQCQNDFS